MQDLTGPHLDPVMIAATWRCPLRRAGHACRHPHSSQRIDQQNAQACAGRVAG